MSPFRKILLLSVADLGAKALYFVAFLYLAQTLGVATYGALEFAISLRTYLLIAADGGLELWSIREASRSKDLVGLVGTLIPFRFLMAGCSTLLLLAGLAVLPDNPNLHRIMPILALTVIVQSVNLKWVFVGQQQMSRVAGGLMASQIAFSAGVIVGVDGPEKVVWVPVCWLGGELLLCLYFWTNFLRQYGRPRLRFQPRLVWTTLRSAFTMGAAHVLSLVNYTFDSVLIGLWLGPGAVGWYAAAYKPVTAALAVPVSYYMGLFPTLSKVYGENRPRFAFLISRSLRLTTVVSLPVGIAGFFLAGPFIDFLFGPNYLPSVTPLQLLAVSVVLVTLRGNFRQGLNAAGHQRCDLLCALVSVSVNIALNLTLIPLFGITGAAAATVASETVWLVVSFWMFRRYTGAAVALSGVVKPAIAGGVMTACLAATGQTHWIARGALGGVVYLLVLGLLREPELLARLPLRKTATTPTSA